MSRSTAIIILLILSEAVGVLLGEWFFQLFLQAVPQVVLSNFNSQASRIAHWLYGAGVGLVLFVWSFVGMAMSRLTQSSSKAAKT